MNSDQIISILKVITVEDSLLVAERIQAMLADVPNVKFLGNATSIQEAFKLIANYEPHVAILDIHLKKDTPYASGIDLLASLRRTYPTMKIIMLTSLSDIRYRDICMSLGADYFFDKLYDFDKVPDALKKIQL